MSKPVLSSVTLGSVKVIIEMPDYPHRGDRLLVEHIEKLLDAAAIVAARSDQRGDVWRRSGIKGACFQLMAKAERAFSEAMSERVPDPDNFIDAINYAAFALLLLDDAADIDGDWPWGGS